MESQSTADQGVGKELLTDAKNVGSTAVNRLHSEVDNRKGAAATQAKSLSSAINRAGDELEGDAPEWLRSAFTQGAQQVQKFADALEQKDSRQLVDEVSQFARQSPGTFLAACAAAGFAAARVFQAGAKGSQPTQPAPVGTDAQTRGADAPFGLPGQSSDQFTTRPAEGQFV